jgi:hypothetical protein
MLLLKFYLFLIANIRKFHPSSQESDFRLYMSDSNKQFQDSEIIPTDGMQTVASHSFKYSKMFSMLDDQLTSILSKVKHVNTQVELEVYINSRYYAVHVFPSKSFS